MRIIPEVILYARTTVENYRISFLFIYLRIAFVVFLSGAMTMAAVPLLVPSFNQFAAGQPWVLATILAALVAILSSPALYYWTVRPLSLLRDQAIVEARKTVGYLNETQSIGKIGCWEMSIAEGTIHWSDEIYRIFEVDPDGFDGSYESFLELVHPDDRAANDRDYKASLSDGTPYDAIYRIVVPSGRVKWIHERCNTAFNDEGQPVSSFGIAQDITQIKLAEKAKSDFVATVSHELRTPLTSIKSALSMIRSGVTGDLPEKAHALCEIAYKNSDRLSRLVNDILDFEKIGAGKMRFHMVELDLVELIENAIEANKAYGDQYGIRFEAIEIDEPVRVTGDPDRLMQVMANLMSNAAKYSHRGDKVEVSLGKGTSGARIAVRDFGHGIPESAQATIFEQFTQAESAWQHQVGGTGLGLSIAKSIVEGHGGTIGFASEVGKGTMFFFDLPA